MNIVIFSKDRACQLDALLRSLKSNFAEYDDSYVSVIWKGSRGFKGAYTKIKDKFPEVNMIAEDNFKQQTIGAIDEVQKHTMFLVDDIMFKHPFSESDGHFELLGERNEALCVSLRLDKRINRCYATDEEQSVPDLSFLPTWNWKCETGDWGYPMSLDGNVYKTRVIKKMVRATDFNNPNNFESALDLYVKQHDNSPSVMICYTENSRLFNVPANRVQDSVQNRHEDSHDPKALNDLFYKDHKVIDISSLSEVENTSCHWPFEYGFTKEE